MILKSIQLERNNKMGLNVFRISKASYDVDSKYEPIIPQNNPNPLNYEIIKTFIHMSIVPMSVKKLWFKDKKFKEWYDRERQISGS